MKKTIVYALAALCLVTDAQTEGQNALPRRSRTNSVLPGTNQGPNSFDKINDLFTLGNAAEKRGEFGLAERLYVQATQVTLDTVSPHVHLAQFYDKRGREREALKEYRIVVAGTPRSRSSHQTDPHILCRLGDLSTKFGHEEEARWAYARATLDTVKSNQRPFPVPLDASLGALKATAHLAAAIRNGEFGDDAGKIRELKTAVAACPDDWMPHLHLAADYGAGREFKKAEEEINLAARLVKNAESRAWVDKLRKRFDLG